MSILRNGNVPCHYILNFPVYFRIVLCRLSDLRKDHVALLNLRVKGHQPHSPTSTHLHPTPRHPSVRLHATTHPAPCPMLYPSPHHNPR